MSFMEPLLALQDVDTQLDELQKELQDIPLRKQHDSARLQEAQNRLNGAKAEMLAVQTRIADFELQVKALRDQITKLRQQQLVLKTNREFRAMETEISNHLHEIEALEEQQLMAMDLVPAVQERIDTAQEHFTSEKASIDTYGAELDQRLEEVKRRLAETETLHSEVVNRVPFAHLRRYQRLRSARRPTVVQLRDGVCTGCHLQQTPATRHLVLRDNEIVCCESCGRILYA